MAARPYNPKLQEMGGRETPASHWPASVAMQGLLALRKTLSGRIRRMYSDMTSWPPQVPDTVFYAFNWAFFKIAVGDETS